MNESNPYRTALFAIGALGLVAAVILFVIGSRAGLEGLGAIAVAGAIFPVAGISFVAWLAIEAISWTQPAESAVLGRD